MDASTLSNTPDAPSHIAADSSAPDITGNTVAVLVGNKNFYVHENLLVSSSKFFQNAMKPEWRTDPSKPVDLSDAKMSAFKKYSEWLYTKQIYFSDNEKSYTTAQSYILLARLYVFGEKIMDQDFQQAVLVTLISLHDAQGKAISIDTIRIIYEGTTASDPARRLMADMCALTALPTSCRITKLDPSVDGEFMVDLCAALVKHRARPDKRHQQPWATKIESYLSGRQDEEAVITTQATSEELMDISGI